MSVPTQPGAGAAACDGPRYLAAFGPKRVPHCFTDVLILGGGLAGLRAALACDPTFVPVDAAIVGIVDAVSVEAR